MVDVHDEDSSSGTSAEPSGLDFDVDALAADLQAHAGPEVDDSEFEELEDLVEVPDEPTHPRRLYLVVDGRVHAVTTERFVIGRVSSQCDLAIIDANVSRQHCAIERRDGQFYVMDLGSTNGVVVDGVRVDDHPIEAGDVLVLSGHRIECTFEPPGPTPVEAVVAEAPTPAAIARAVTGRMPAVAEPVAPAALQQAPVRHAPVGATFEARVEAQLASISTDLAALVATMQRLVERVEGLEGVEALAQVIHRRLEQGKPS